MRRVLSCYTNAYGHWGVWTAVERIRSAGIHHVELALRPHSLGGLLIPEEAVLTERTSESTAARFVEHLRKHDVSISACNVGGADIRTQEGLDITAQRIRCASRWLNATLVVSNAGQPTDENERRTIIKQLRSLGNIAAELGVTIALETHKGPTQNAQAMLQLMHELDHPCIRLNFDTGNIAYYNHAANPAHELAHVVEWVRNVHLKDNRGGYQDWHFPALGEGGAVDFAAIRQLLDNAGFSGPYTIEIEGLGGEPEPGLEERHARVTRSVEHLRKTGYFEDQL